MPEPGRAREVVERLLTAEGRASARLAEADARARERLLEAEREAVRRRAEAGERADRENLDSLERARRDAESEAAVRLERVEAHWRRLGDAARARADGVAEHVVAWVCGADGQEDPG